MKKIIVALCVTAMLGGAAGAMIKNAGAGAKTVPLAVPVEHSKTALLQVLSNKYASHLPKKVSGKVRRAMRKTMAAQTLNAYVRAIAFVQAERSKMGVKK